jgi:hypothetical protein
MAVNLSKNERKGTPAIVPTGVRDAKVDCEAFNENTECLGVR